MTETDNTLENQPTPIQKLSFAGCIGLCFLGVFLVVWNFIGVILAVIFVTDFNLAAGETYVCGVMLLVNLLVTAYILYRVTTSRSRRKKVQQQSAQQENILEIPPRDANAGRGSDVGCLVGFLLIWNFGTLSLVVEFVEHFSFFNPATYFMVFWFACSALLTLFLVQQIYVKTIPQRLIVTPEGLQISGLSKSLHKHFFPRDQSLRLELRLDKRYPGRVNSLTSLGLVAKHQHGSKWVRLAPNHNSSSQRELFYKVADFLTHHGFDFIADNYQDEPEKEEPAEPHIKPKVGATLVIDPRGKKKDLGSIAFLSLFTIVWIGATMFLCTMPLAVFAVKVFVVCWVSFSVLLFGTVGWHVWAGLQKHTLTIEPGSILINSPGIVGRKERRISKQEIDCLFFGHYDDQQSDGPEAGISVNILTTHKTKNRIQFAQFFHPDERRHVFEDVVAFLQENGFEFEVEDEVGNSKS